MYSKLTRNVLLYPFVHTYLGWVIFIVTTLVYVFTLEPSSSFWDSGEYIAASYKLQIPHPPGAPMFLLFGRLFSMFSMGNTEYVAFAVNSLSAVSSGLTIMFLYWTIVMIARKLIKHNTTRESSQLMLIGSGLLGSLSFAFTDTFWYSATETELYAFSTFITAFVFWAIFRWDQIDDPTKSNKWLIMIAYVMGLSVGVHLLNLLTIPSIALVIYFKRYKPSLKGMVWTLMLSGIALVFVLYGLVTGANIAKTLEIFMINDVGLPFGSGIILFMLLLITGLMFGIHYSVKKQYVNLNTVLLGIAFVIIGYSSYSVILIRANFNTPINQNNPDNLLKLISYVNMDQYPKRPLLYGKNFTAELIDQKKGAPIYEIGEDKYKVKDNLIENVYDPAHNTVFPRMYSTIQDGHARQYEDIVGLKRGEKPSVSDNIAYFFKHQVTHMYVRYFMWNFVGRDGSIEGAGWLNPMDKFKSVPALLSLDKARNNYLMIPFLLGIIGVLFLSKKNKNQLLVTGALFVMTGFALVVYINGPPSEPRERDYIYIGSYYAFSLWIGIGFIGICSMLNKLFPAGKLAPVILTFFIAMASPAILLTENYDDHNRSERRFNVDQARNTLMSCAPNAILFTGGDNDTYPLWYVQEVEGIRTDVRVIVLSYANVDWYIDQFYETMNESQPLPLTLSKKNYKQGGLNDYLPYVPNPKIKGAVNTNQLIKLIKNEHPSLQVRASFDNLNMIPTKEFYTQIDTNKVLASKVVPHNLEQLVAKRMSYSMKGRGLDKKDLLIMDLIDTNRWERPIYFNYTSLRSVNLDLQKSVVNEGANYRLLPINNPDDSDIPIDEDTMYENLMEKNKWTDLHETTAFFDDYRKNFVSVQRNSFNTLTQSLIDSGKIDKAKQVISKSLDTFPDDVIPYDYNNVQTAGLLLTLHDKDTADNVAKKILARADEFLEYLHDNDKEIYSREKMLNLVALRDLAAVYGRFGHTEQASEYARAFSRHIEYFNG